MPQTSPINWIATSLMMVVAVKTLASNNLTNFSFNLENKKMTMKKNMSWAW